MRKLPSRHEGYSLDLDSTRLLHEDGTQEGAQIGYTRVLPAPAAGGPREGQAGRAILVEAGQLRLCQQRRGLRARPARQPARPHPAAGDPRRLRLLPGRAAHAVGGSASALHRCRATHLAHPDSDHTRHGLGALRKSPAPRWPKCSIKNLAGAPPAA